MFRLIERLLYIEDTTDEMIERLTEVLERMTRSERLYWSKQKRKQFELLQQTMEDAENRRLGKTWRDKQKAKERRQQEEWQKDVRERMYARRAKLEQRRANDVLNRSGLIQMENTSDY